MKPLKEEAEPIARLLGPERTGTVGWVYLWNTSELSILWVDRRLPAGYIDPPVPTDILTRARSITSDAVTELLAALSSGEDAG
ncbi:hypothetical protein [Pseudooceanicola atlanticus]|uniref:Uncharacterized protein n=1 Tax=Pseudooceanicola atlanticus TaxID=1461694 RepID=A0A0A0E8X6_9RHOB|nr:hypothetical protein [Pseudooceanicola atlanticus]KGM46650.1 hypothetical protein ATO9_22805 [Pseudooceanicola atlanticus]